MKGTGELLRSTKLKKPVAMSTALVMTVWNTARIDWKKEMMVLKMEEMRLLRDSNTPAMFALGFWSLIGRLVVKCEGSVRSVMMFLGLLGNGS